MAKLLSTAMIQIRLPKEILNRLDRIAQSRLLSRSDVVREAVLMYLAGQKDGQSDLPQFP